MVPEDLVFVIVSKLMLLERDLDILLQNLKTVMDYFENFVMTVQWNLDLRKILGVTKIFLKSRFLVMECLFR